MQFIEKNNLFDLLNVNKMFIINYDNIFKIYHYFMTYLNIYFYLKYLQKYMKNDFLEALLSWFCTHSGRCWLIKSSGH